MSSSSSAPVLVTGATGFVGAHTALAALQAGYHVRGTARSQAKADDVSNAPAFQQYAKDGKLTWSIVEDLVEGDFTDAAKGTQGVLHTASPFHFSGKDPEKDYLKPAQEGTLNVLRAAQKAGVKNFVLTSSFAAVLSMDDGLPYNERSYTEGDWNNATYESAKQSSDNGYIYCASKKVAEEAAYDYVKEKGLDIKVASICPPMIFGPVVHPIAKLDDLNTSSASLWALINGSQKEIPETGFPAFASVRDVAKAHVVALQKQAEGRFLICSGSYSHESLVAFVKEKYGDKVSTASITKPEKEWIDRDARTFKLDTSRAHKELGIEFQSYDSLFTETFENLLELKQAGK